MRAYFRRFSPGPAIRDLRQFLALRRPHELWFGILAIVLTGLILIGFVKDSHFEQVRKSNIIYVDSWPLSRTDREIIEQQKIDQVKRDKEAAEFRARQEKVRREFKKMDDALERYGL